MRLPSQLLIAVCCLCLTSCGILTGSRADAPVESGELSSDAREALSKKFPGWQMATLDPQVNSCAAGRTELPLRVVFDPDGDGATDVALAIQTSQGTRLVVILNRAWDVAIHDLDALGAGPANGFLEIIPRGRRFTNPASKLDDYFSNPTLSVIRCGEPVTAYRWNAAGFDKIVLGG